MLRWIDKDPLKINQNDLEKYNAYLYDIYKQNSIVIHSVAINYFMRYLGKDFKIPIPPKVKVQTTPLTEHEMEKIIQCSKNDTRSYALLLTLRDTIQRVQAILNIDVDDVDFREFKIRFRRTKGGQPHTARISRRTAQAIRRYIAKGRVRPKGGTKPLFTSIHGNRITKELCNQTVKKYAARAGIAKRVYPHIFRHSGITIMDKHGVSIKVIQAQSGHRDIKTLMNYIHPDEDYIRHEFDRTLGYNKEHSDEPIYDTGPKIELQVETQLDDNRRKRMLLDALLTGKISEDTYKLALEQLRNFSES